MSERKHWTLWQAVLIASTAIAVSFLALIAVGAFAGYLKARSGPKTVEIIRYVTVASSAGGAPAHSAPSATGPVP